MLVNLVSALSAIESGVEYILFVTEDNRHLFSEAMPSRFIYVAPTWVRSPTRRIFYELFILPLEVKRIDVDFFFAVNQIYAPWMPCPVSSLVQNTSCIITIGFPIMITGEAHGCYAKFATDFSRRLVVYVHVERHM